MEWLRIGVAASLALVYGCATGRELGTSPPACPEMAARVDGQPIPMRRVQLEAALSLRRNPQLEPQPAHVFALDGLITRELMFREAERRGLAVDDTAISAMEKGLQDLFPEEEARNAFLARYGLAAEAYRADMRVQALSRAATMDESEKIPVASDAEARAFIEANEPGREPNAQQIDAARWELTRMRRGMATRNLVESAWARARIDRYFVAGACDPSLPPAGPRP
jgi:hypothetical protein